MADTIRQLAALQALLADNTSGAISPQDLRDFLVSVMPTGRSATKVVTHPAASALRQAQADYAGGGPDINAAIAAAAGGKVELTEGLFDIVNPVLMNVDNQILEGQGHRATIIKLPATGAITGVIAGNALTPTACVVGVELRKLRLHGNGDVRTGADGHGIRWAAKASIMSDIEAVYMRGHGIDLSGVSVPNPSSVNTFHNIRVGAPGVGGAAYDENTYGIYGGAYVADAKWTNVVTEHFRRGMSFGGQYGASGQFFTNVLISEALEASLFLTNSATMFFENMHIINYGATGAYTPRGIYLYAGATPGVSGDEGLGGHLVHLGFTNCFIWPHTNGAAGDIMKISSPSGGGKIYDVNFGKCQFGYNPEAGAAGTAAVGINFFAVGAAVKYGNIQIHDSIFENITTPVANWPPVHAGNPTVSEAGTVSFKNNRGSLVDGKIGDPGASAAIPVNDSGHVALVTAGAETRTIAAPSCAGLDLVLYAKTLVGNCVVTVTNTLNEAGQTTITFSATGQSCRLYSVEEGSTFRWRLATVDGAVLG